MEPVASAMYFPFFILSVCDMGRASIKVFRLAADNEMKDINTVASLVKSIPLYDFRPTRIISNQFFFGFVSYLDRDVALFGKRALVDTAPETERRQINLMDRPRVNYVDMNSTSLVSIRNQRFVLKKDFWMVNNTHVGSPRIKENS